MSAIGTVGARARPLPLAAAVLALAFPAAAATAAGPHPSAEVTAEFASATLYRSHPAVTYDAARVPAGSRVQVLQRRQDKGGDAGNVLIETLRVWGLEPHTRYYAYAYTRACGATPAAAGRRAQAGPSTRHDPENEIWLGFRTNAHGDATSSTRQYWLLPGRAHSVLVESRPDSGPVACVTVALE